MNQIAIYIESGTPITAEGGESVTVNIGNVMIVLSPDDAAVLCAAIEGAGVEESETETDAEPEEQPEA